MSRLPRWLRVPLRNWFSIGVTYGLLGSTIAAGTGANHPTDEIALVMAMPVVTLFLFWMTVVAFLPVPKPGAEPDLNAIANSLSEKKASLAVFVLAILTLVCLFLLPAATLSALAFYSLEISWAVGPALSAAAVIAVILVAVTVLGTLFGKSDRGPRARPGWIEYVFTSFRSWLRLSSLVDSWRSA